MGNKNNELLEKIEQYDSDEIENVIPSERLIYGICQGSAIMVSNFLCACYGPLHLIEDNAIQLGLDQEAWIIIKPGWQANSYWKSEDMVKQLRKKAIPIFNALYLGCIDSKDRNM
ncbi:3825_t:CDS:2 [Gigaspora rosea]|nr:3825_t:CDS:2 [Gigaspora rosea]